MIAPAPSPLLAHYDAQIDGAFRRWLHAALPPSLRATALTLPHCIGLTQSRRWRSWRGVFRSPLMRALPALVAETFPTSSGRIEALGLAHVLLAFVAFVDDRLNDQQTPFVRDVYLVRRCMEAEAEARCIEAAGDRPEFWRIARQMFQQYGAAHAREARRWSAGTWRDDHPRYAREAAGKIAIAQLPAVALALTGGASRAEIDRLVAAFNHCLVALQYTDDVADWQEDFRSGRWTYFVRRHLRANQRHDREAMTMSQLKQRVATGPATAEFLECAVRHYDAALGLTRGFAMPTLHAWIADRCNAVRADVTARRQSLVHALRRCWIP